MFGEYFSCVFGTAKSGRHYQWVSELFGKLEHPVTIGFTGVGRTNCRVLIRNSKGDIIFSKNYLYCHNNGQARQDVIEILNALFYLAEIEPSSGDPDAYLTEPELVHLWGYLRKNILLIIDAQYGVGSTDSEIYGCDHSITLVDKSRNEEELKQLLQQTNDS